MAVRPGPLAALGAAALVCVSALAPTAQARDFFSTLFGGFGGGRAPPQPYISLPFANENGSIPAPRQSEPQPRYVLGGSQAFCVRTCDGRYFPATGSNNESRAASCNSFCPAAETKVVYGSSIDHAATEHGKPYSQLPNAFRYRKEIVVGCTCNGKDEVGLAHVKIRDDPTIRKGDIVAGESGLLVAGRSADKRGAALNFSPASKRIRAKFARIPVVASD